jgi:PAS domain S-box-containing protein
VLADLFVSAVSHGKSAALSGVNRKLPDFIVSRWIQEGGSMSIAINNKVPSSHKGLIFNLILLSIVVGAGWFTTRYLGDKARDEILEYNESTISLHSSHLTDAFNNIERAVNVLSGSPLIAPALISRKDETVANANSALDRYNSGFGESVSYLMDSNGTTIASSNRNDPDSFVGKSYQFRPYFIEAMKGAPGRYFALGATSLKRGFYASYPVRDNKSEIIGVVVIKKDLDEEEARLSRYPHFFFVDPNGIILLSSRKEMNIKSLWPISEETRLALLRSKQFAGIELNAILPREVVDRMEITFDGKNYLASRKVIDPEGWSTVIMTSTERILLYKSVGVIMTIWICSFIAVPMIINYRTSRSAEMLRVSETRYRELFDNISSGVAIYEAKDGGKDFVIKDFNKAGERIDGYCKEDIIGKSIHQVRPTIKESGLLNVFERVWRTGIPEHHPVSIYQDERIAACYMNFVYKLPTGEIVTVYDDVTELKLAEESLRESERKFHSIFDSMSEIVVLHELICDSSGRPVDYRILDCNPAFTRSTGIPPERAIGALASQLYDTSEPPYLALYAQVALTGKPTQFEVHFAPMQKHFAISAISPAEGRFATVSTDITERKQAEEALKRSERELSDIVEFLPDATFVIDLEGKVTAWNRAMEEMSGVRKEDMIGQGDHAYTIPFYGERRPQLLDLIDSSDKDLESKYKSVQRKGDTLYVEVFTPALYGGRGAHVWAMGAPLFDDSGNRVGAIESIRDITERKQAEAEKAQLEAQNQQLQKAESLGRMAGAIAHHFNNQLQAVMGNLELAMDDLPQGTRPHAKITQALKASHRASEVSGLMLTYLGQTSDNRELLDLSETCRQGLPMLRAAMPENVVLEAKLPSPGPAVSANANQIQQVLTNLLTNAREAVGDDLGVIHLTLKTVSSADIPASHRFPISWQPEDKAYACLEVTDTGCGIADKDIETVFDPFFSTKFTGRGLGLSVVLGIMRAHGGVITVHSEPGRRSVFRVFFPVSAKEVPRQPDKAATTPEIERGGTVLLVEDEEMVRNMTEALLTRLGFTVLATKDGVEAVEAFRQHQEEIRCVLCDLTMPRMDGWETITALRALRPGIPVVLASGYDEAKVMEGEHAELPQVFLHKPFRMAELKAALGAAMGPSSAESMERY